MKLIIDEQAVSIRKGQNKIIKFLKVQINQTTRRQERCSHQLATKSTRK